MDTIIKINKCTCRNLLGIAPKICPTVTVAQNKGDNDTAHYVAMATSV